MMRLLRCGGARAHTRQGVQVHDGDHAPADTNTPAIHAGAPWTAVS